MTNLKQAVAVAALVGWILAGTPSAATAQGLGFPATEATETIFKQMRSTAQGIMADARSSANLIMGEQARMILQMIDAFEQSNQKTIKLTFNELDKAQQSAVLQASAMLGRLERDKEIAVTQVQGLTSVWSGVIAGIPGTDIPADIFFYHPIAVAPSKVSKVDIAFVGPKLSQADVRLAKPPIANERVFVTSATQVGLELERSKLPFPEEVPLQFGVSLLLNQNPFVWWKPTSWFSNDEVQREARVLLLPKMLAQIEVQTFNGTKTWEEKPGRIAFAEPGEKKDDDTDFSVNVSQEYRKDGWKLRIEDNKIIGLDWATGDDSVETKCAGPRSGKVDPNGFTMYMSHGHKADWKGSKQAVKGSCVGSYVLWREVEGEQAGIRYTERLGWGEPLRFKFEPGVVRYEISIKVLGMNSVLLKEGHPSPTQYLSIIYDGKAGVTFNPKPLDL